MKKILLHQQTVTKLIWKHPKNVWAPARGKTKIANNPNEQNCTRVSASSAVNDPGPRIWFWLDQQAVKVCKTCSFVYESEYGSANAASNCWAACVDNLGRVVSFTTCVASSWSDKLGIAEPAWQLEIWYSQSLMTPCSATLVLAAVVSFDPNLVAQSLLCGWFYCNSAFPAEDTFELCLPSLCSLFHDVDQMWGWP